MSTNLLEPGKRIRPLLNCDEAKELSEKLFRFKVTEIIEMDSYDDRNYLVELECDYNGYGKQFVLKITNSLDTSMTGLMEAINDMINFISSSMTIKVPYPIANSDGSLISRVELKSSKDNLFAVRLLMFIPGTIMNKISYTEDILFQTGATLGQLTEKLRNYSNPDLERRQTIWSLLNVPKLKKFLFAVENPQHRLLVENIIEQFEQMTQTFGQLQTSIIHGDINEQNIIVDKLTDDKEDGKWSVIGLIDFGDVNKAPAIFDLAILCCYITLDSKLIDPMEAPSYVISGYQSVIKITDQEWDVLPICVMTRLAQSLTLGSYSYLNDQGNEYIMSSTRKVGSILVQMVSYGTDKLRQMWQEKSNASD